MTKKKKIEQYGAISILFFSIFLYLWFLLQDLSFYMYGFDDFHLIYQMLPLTFIELLSLAFFKPLQLYQGFLGLGIFQRNIHGVFLKLSYIISPTNPLTYHLLRAFFLAGIGIIIYFFTRKIIKSKIVSIITAFMYCSLPVVYDALRHIGAAEPFSQFFALLTLYLFVTFYTDKKSDTILKKYLYPTIIFILAIVAIKSRETEIVLLTVLFLFLIWKYKEIKNNKRWFALIFLLSLYIIPPIIVHFNPSLEQSHDNIQITKNKVLTNIKHLLIYNPETKTGNGEQIPVIFSLRQYLSETPGSLLGSIGFFIAWYTIIISSICIYYFVKHKKIPPIVANDYFSCALIWLITTLSLMMLYVNPTDHTDIRYVGVLALPTLLVIIPTLYTFTQHIKHLKIRYLSKNIMIVFLVILVLSIVINAEITSIHRRGGIGSRHIGMEQSTTTIFQDFYNQSFDNSFFFALTEISGDDKYIKCRLNTDIQLPEITVTNDPFLAFTRLITSENINESLSKYGIVYLITYSKPLNVSEYPNAELIKEIYPCEKGYYCQLKNFFKNQKIIHTAFKKEFDKEPKYFVYKIVHYKTSFETPIKIRCLGKEGLPENKI